MTHMDDDSPVAAHAIVQELSQKSEDDLTAYGLIRALGRMGYVEAEPVLVRYLSSPVADLRQITLRSLVFWWGQGERYERVCREMLINDIDAGVRATAARCMGTIYKGTQDRSVLKLLADILRNEDNDRFVREAAYSAMLEVIGFPPKSWPSAARDTDFEVDVDWQLVDTWSS